MEQSTNNSVSEELKIKTTDEEPFNICLTNNYAFLKIFKKEENVKGFLISWEIRDKENESFNPFDSSVVWFNIKIPPSLIKKTAKKSVCKFSLYQFMIVNTKS